MDNPKQDPEEGQARDPEERDGELLEEDLQDSDEEPIRLGIDPQPLRAGESAEALLDPQLRADVQRAWRQAERDAGVFADLKRAEQEVRAMLPDLQAIAEMDLAYRRALQGLSGIQALNETVKGGGDLVIRQGDPEAKAIEAAAEASEAMDNRLAVEVRRDEALTKTVELLGVIADAAARTHAAVERSADAGADTHAALERSASIQRLILLAATVGALSGLLALLLPLF